MPGQPCRSKVCPQDSEAVTVRMVMAIYVLQNVDDRRRKWDLPDRPTPGRVEVKK